MSMHVRAVTAAAVLMWFVALNAVPSTQAPRGELPAGEGRDVVIRVCSECHGLDQVAGQYRSRDEWTYVVEDMAGRSGGATDDDVKMIVTYVVAHFGRVNVNTASEGDLVEIVQLTKDEAAAIVEFRMKQGEFKTLEDLRQVPGLDFGRIQERKDHIGFTGA